MALTLRTDAVPTDRARIVLFGWTGTCRLATRDGKIKIGGAGGRMWYDRAR